MTSRIQNKNTKQKTTAASFFHNVRAFNICLVCLIILAGFLYLTQVNASAVKGYVIRDLQVKLEDSKLNNKKLEYQAQALQSVGGISAKAAPLGMVVADHVEYLQMPGGEVAVAR